jgi:hypothetical protein
MCHAVDAHGRQAPVAARHHDRFVPYVAHFPLANAFVLVEGYENMLPFGAGEDCPQMAIAAEQEGSNH